MATRRRCGDDDGDDDGGDDVATRPHGNAGGPHDDVGDPGGRPNGGDIDADANDATGNDVDDNANGGGAQSTVDDDKPDPHTGPNRSSIAHLRLNMKDIGILQPSHTFETFVSDFVQKSNKKFFLYFAHTR